MTYSSGSIIIDDDYNIFATGNAAGTGDDGVANINTIWGSGTGDKGYGQSTTITPVSAGSTITATQWATLFTRMTSIANHQGTGITPIGNPGTGDTISAAAALSSNITNIFNGRLDATANGTDITSNGTTTTTSAWSTSATTTKTITFASSDALRYFFNAGGMIRMSFSRSGGTSSTQNTSWTTLLSNVGTIVVTGSAASKSIASVNYTGTTKIGGAGTVTTLLTGTGALDYTGSPVTIFKQFASTYTYTSNFAQINASVSGSVISFAVTLSDAYSTGNPDNVDGTLTMTTVVRPPSTTYLSNTWGTPTMNAASWSLT